MSHRRLWARSTQEIQVSDIIERYHTPLDFRTKLAGLITEICRENNYVRVIEVGSETGLTSMLLGAELEITYFDLNGDAIEKAKQACEQLHKKGRFVVGDMFSMSFRDRAYDVVFNSGVVEHYNRSDRIRMLREYSRILRDDGTMVLGVPNHHSLPYRCAYMLKKRILGGYQWAWPTEYRIYDLRKELKATGLRLVKRLTFGKVTLFGFWSFSRILRKLWTWSDRLFHHEGYLTTLVIKKDRAGEVSGQCG